MVADRNDAGPRSAIEDRFMNDARYFFDAARQQYESDSDRRDWYAMVDQVLNDEHEIQVPDTMVATGRVEKVYSGRAPQLLDMAVNLTLDPDPDGVQIHAAQPGDSNKAEGLKEDVEAWTGGLLRLLRDRGEGDFLADIVEDGHKRGRTFARVRVQTEPTGKWADMEPEERYGRGYLPIMVDWCPAEGIIDRWSRGPDGGLTEVWQFETVAVDEVLSTYVDDDGDPLATKLSESWDRGRRERIASQGANRPTMQDTCTLVTYADSTNIVIGVMDMPLWGDTDSAGWGIAHHGIDEVLVDEPHGFDVVPYVAFGVRQRATKNPAKRGFGFLDKLVPIIRQYDQALTQHHSYSRLVAWMTLYLKKAAGMEEMPGGDDRGAQIELDEAGIWNGTRPGEEVMPVRMTDSESVRLLENDVGKFEALIEVHTFPKVVGGQNTGGGDSGYAINLLQSGGSLSLDRPAFGFGKGVAQLCRLLLRAGKVLIDEGQGPVPVRHVSDEGMKYVTLKEAHVGKKGEPFIDWDFTAKLRSTPPEGSAALMQTLSIEKQNDWGSDLEREQKLGNRNPLRSFRRRLQEKVLNHPKTIDLMVDANLNAVLAELQNEALAKLQLPPGGQIDSGLAQVIQGDQDPAAAALRAQIDMTGMPPAPAALGGLPGQMPNVAPETPQPTANTVLSNAGVDTTAGGGIPGQGMAIPGGSERVTRGLGI